jgi:D-amino-acid oxidase
MYFRSGQRLGSHNTHVFPRGTDGGIILGGCRFNGDWDESFDSEVGQDIIKRCCALVPEPGKPSDLRIIKKGVGFRRKYYSIVTKYRSLLLMTRLT